MDPEIEKTVRDILGGDFTGENDDASDNDAHKNTRNMVIK